MKIGILTWQLGALSIPQLSVLTVRGCSARRLHWGIFLFVQRPSTSLRNWIRKSLKVRHYWFYNFQLPTISTHLRRWYLILSIHSMPCLTQINHLLFQGLSNSPLISKLIFWIHNIPLVLMPYLLKAIHWASRVMPSTGKAFHLQRPANRPIRSPLARCKLSPPFAQAVDGSME